MKLAYLLLAAALLLRADAPPGTLTEIAPGVWSWRFDAVNAAEHQTEHTFSVDRILPGAPTQTLILTCNGELDEREDPTLVDVLEKRCLDLVFAVGGT